VTVAAVILFESIEGALADAAGRPAVRRTVESAWAGGAIPIVVVAPVDDGQVAEALAGAPAVLAEPVPQRPTAAARQAGPATQFERGIDVALQRVSETDAVLIWPGRMVWVDAETVTSLIEAHGVEREAVLRPSFDGQLGWPLLVPLARRGELAWPVACGPSTPVTRALSTTRR
jgi:CTP:molybdopterin cytidylyltransferase MocA